MTKTASQPRQSYTFSTQADNSAHSDAVLALGRKLVDELGLDPSVDTLGRWMAHHIADLITAADTAPGEEKQAVEKKCFEAILTLWKHRAELPNGMRPFEELEPVIRAVESLDPNDSTPRYFRTFHSSAEKERGETEANKWLDLASGLDYSAKLLIGHCLMQAASVAVDKSKEWVKLAEAAKADDGVPEIVIRFISEDADCGNITRNDTDNMLGIKDKITRLDAFLALSGALSDELKGKLQAVPTGR